MTDLRYCELSSLQVFPAAWEEEEPASEEQLGWTSSLREVEYQVRLSRQRVGSLTSPGFPYPNKRSAALAAEGP